MKAAAVCGVAGAGLCGVYRERERLRRVERVTTEASLVRLSRDPLIKEWMSTMASGHAHLFGGMPAEVFVNKATGEPMFGKVEPPTTLPRTVLDAHPPAATSSVFSNPWLALLVVPIPFMLAYQAGCMCVPAPRGCTDQALLQYVQFDPALKHWLGMQHQDPRPRFSDLFEFRDFFEGEGPPGHF